MTSNLISIEFILIWEENNILENLKPYVDNMVLSIQQLDHIHQNKIVLQNDIGKHLWKQPEQCYIILNYP
jgi:hypothetical protein